MNINGITTIVSSSCNLKCSFCYLHKHNALINFDKEILEAWNNQSYPKIVDRVINKMGENSYNIQNWTLWGGESLIHIDSITKNVKEIFSLFPNINNIILSTNWTININQFFEFLKEIDCYATKDVDIQLQLSIDGPEGLLSEQGHNGWKYYKENIKLFTNLMNNHKFKNITVHLYLNATVAKETYIEVFQKKENIIDYVSKMYDFINYMKSLTVSRYLEIDCNYIFPGCANPHDATTQEGIKIGEIAKLWDEVCADSFPELNNKYGLNIDFGHGINGLFGEGNYFNANLECCELRINYTIMPDGTIVECPSSYIEHLEDYQKECLAMNDINRYQSSLIHASVSFNPLIATNEEIEKFNWYVHNGVRDTSSTYLHFMVETAKELAKVGQIPRRYLYDTSSLINYLLDLSHVSFCTHDNINLTMNPFLTSVSFYRRYLNGYIEHIHENYKYALKGNII